MRREGFFAASRTVTEQHSILDKPRVVLPFNGGGLVSKDNGVSTVNSLEASRVWLRRRSHHLGVDEPVPSPVSEGDILKMVTGPSPVAEEDILKVATKPPLAGGESALEVNADLATPVAPSNPVMAQSWDITNSVRKAVRRVDP